MMRELTKTSYNGSEGNGYSRSDLKFDMISKYTPVNKLLSKIRNENGVNSLLREMEDAIISSDFNIFNEVYGEVKGLIESHPILSLCYNEPNGSQKSYEDVEETDNITYESPLAGLEDVEETDNITYESPLAGLLREKD